MEWVKDVGGRHTSRGLAHPYTLGMHLTHSLALHPSPRLAGCQALTAPRQCPSCPQWCWSQGCSCQPARTARCGVSLSYSQPVPPLLEPHLPPWRDDHDCPITTTMSFVPAPPSSSATFAIFSIAATPALKAPTVMCN